MSVSHFSSSTIFHAVYVDDIVITGNEHHGIKQLKGYVSFHFHMKGLSLLRYFGIMVTQSKQKNFCL